MTEVDIKNAFGMNCAASPDPEVCKADSPVFAKDRPGEWTLVKDKSQPKTNIDRITRTAGGTLHLVQGDAEQIGLPSHIPVRVDNFERCRDVDITRIPERRGVLSNESSHLFNRERILGSGPWTLGGVDEGPRLRRDRVTAIGERVHHFDSGLCRAPPPFRERDILYPATPPRVESRVISTLR